MSSAKDTTALAHEQLSSEVETVVRAFLKSEGGAENAHELGENDELWAQFDSLLIMELLIHLEEHFGVQLNKGTLNPDDLKTIARIRDAATKAIRAAAQP
jgi:acyl carrier protein